MKSRTSGLKKRRTHWGACICMHAHPAHARKKGRELCHVVKKKRREEEGQGLQEGLPPPGTC